MKHLLAIVLTSITAHCLSQDFPQHDYDLSSMIESIFPVQDLDIDYVQLYENLAQVLSNPIDLNNASDEELRSLFILSENQIANLLNHRVKFGPFISVYELQAVPDFDETIFYKIIPFVTVGKGQQNWRSLPKRILQEENNYLLLRINRTLESRHGYSSSALPSGQYTGAPDRIYSRFRTSRSSDFSLGFTTEKDAGEQMKWSPSQKYYGFDYTSYHVQVMNKGAVSNLILGDFQAQYGQGLILGGGFGVGKGAESITTIRRSNLGFLPYTSLSETGFFRGAAASLKITPHLTINTFASRIHQDGAILTDSLGFSLSSISTSGLHRTETEIRNRKAFRESNLGGIINFKNRSVEAGAIIHHTDFAIPLNRKATRYNQFAFNGSSNTNAGIYLNYSIGNGTFFSEYSQTFHYGKAYVLGMLGSLSNHLDLSMVYRHYDKDFYSFYGNAFSESTNLQNENGFYLGMKYRFNKTKHITGYLDLFQFPWLRYRGYSPSHGYEWMIRYNFQPHKGLLFYVQLREESKIRNHTSDSNLYTTENAVKRNLWLNLDYEINAHLSFKSRVQLSNFGFEQKKTSGIAIIQDINLSVRHFTLSARYALFDTQDFENRQYVYERDVWLAYSFPFYEGVGVRNYILLQYGISKKITAWLKWSQTWFKDRDTIGSGSDRIDGKSINDLKLQLRIKF